MVGQELVADIVEVADERHGDAHLVEPVADFRDGGGGLVAVDGDPDQLRAGTGERRHLAGGALDVGGVGVGHRLDDDRAIAADHDAADIDGDGGAAGKGAVEDGHGERRPGACFEARRSAASPSAWRSG